MGPETRQSLLLRIRDVADTVAWDEFVTIYAPLIYAYSRHRGLQDADAADVSQTVLQSIAQSIARFDYDRSLGTFRAWLFTITRNQVSKTLQKRSQLPIVTSDASLQAGIDGQIDPSSDEERWNRQHEQHLFHWAVEKVRDEFQDKTWQAFWNVAVEGRPVANTAEALGMSSGAIYIAKSRVTARLRQLVESIETC